LPLLCSVFSELISLLHFFILVWKHLAKTAMHYRSSAVTALK